MMRPLPALGCILFLTATPALAGSHGGHHSSHSHGHSSSHHTSSHSSSSHTSSHSSSSSHSTHSSTHTTTVHGDRCSACARDARGRILRSTEAKKAFMDATGYPHGRPGYVIDHIQPLACGGADSPANMQWQTIADAKSKDKIERKGCH